MKGSDLQKTANGGTSWASVKGTISGTPVNGAVSASNPDDVWITVSGYTATSKVYHSTNGGQSWTNETLSGLPNLPCGAVALDNLGQNGVYVGTDNGVFFKRDGIAGWQNFSDKLPNASVRELVIARKGANDADRMLVAATYGRGVWRTRLWGDPSLVKRDAPAPSLRDFKATLAGPMLTIRFRLGSGADAGGASLRLARADGKVVFRESIRGGQYERRIDVSGSGKGLYFVHLEKAGRQVSRPVAVY